MPKKLVRIIAAIVGVSGLVVMIAAVYPIAQYEAISKEKYPMLLDPLVSSDGLSGNTLKDYDFTKASNWFVGGASREEFEASKVSFYNLSIPKLRIDRAIVAVGGDDLAKHLIQYPGTALPGRAGNAVIFGHSILPAFYNPKNYLAIFSLLPTLNEGDAIQVDFDGIEYTYRVEEMFEVLPTDIQVLAQNPTDSFLTLVTCTPPGDPRKPKRLIVRARIQPA